MKRLIELLRNDENQFLVVSGNIYDKVLLCGKEWEKVEQFIFDVSANKFPYFLQYTLTNGIEVLRGDINALKKTSTRNKKSEIEELAEIAVGRSLSKGELPKEPIECFSFVNKLLFESKQRTIILIKDLDILIKDFEMTAAHDTKIITALLRRWAEKIPNGHCVILLVRSSATLPNFLFDRDLGVHSLFIAKPNEEERKNYLITLGVKEEVASIAKSSSGLSLKNLEKICKKIPTAISERGKSEEKIQKISETVFQVKKEILESEYGDILEIMSPKWGFEAIGGLEKPIAEAKAIVKAIKDGEYELVPMGMLLCGPPGTGKTVFAEALAKESGMNFVRPKNLRSMWLGQSEERQLRFNEAIRDLAPVIVFIDEVDQAQGQRGGFDGDSGVNRRLFGEVLKIMSDSSLRGKILWLLATNRPDLMDPAMKRPGRCDLRVPFLPPDIEEQTKIFEAMRRKYPNVRTDVKEWEQFCIKGYTGADIEVIFLRANQHARRDGREIITTEDMKWAIEDYIPQRSDAKKVAIWTLLAIAECSSKSLLPDNYEEVAEDAIEILTGVRPEEVEQAIEEELAKKPLSQNAN
jgi:SpoVK/Ycf46/Vps4 family AAA+-type ATPase